MRFVLLVAFFVFWAAVIVVRLAWLQLAEHGKFVEMAARQQLHGFEVAPRRGILFDRNLRELAMTVSVDSVFAVPSEIADKPSTAAALAKVVHLDPTEKFTTSEQIAARMQASRNFAWVARKLDADIIAKVKALNLKGVYFQKEFKRVYPNDELAAQVLGYVGTDDTGLGGIERKFDDDLHGTPGHMLTSLDAKRHVLNSEESEPLPGENLQLSIDENIQFMAEHALDHAMEKYKALNGTVVVQDAHTGQILALAIRPTFNPNDFRHATNGLLRNHAVSDIYEPGSTFKLVTYSAALDANVITPDTVIDCQGSVITLFGRTIHDDHGDHFGRLTASEALWHSSNVGAIKVAMAMGREKFYSYMRAYGFGARSGIELPSETRGILRPTHRWGATSIASIAIGQEVGVTPVQLVSMVSTIANGGTYLPPHMLMNTADSTNAKLQAQPFHPDGELPSALPDGAHRVISPLVSAEMRKMMEGIVLYGTGRTAALNGYSAGGKTGTAQKIDIATHTYSKTAVVASFAGFAPINNPAISVAVIIDSPQGEHHGAFVSAPVFAEVAQQVLEYLGVPHDEPLKPQKELDEARNQPIPPEDTEDDGSDLEAMFAEANNLPADDPLRTPQNAQLPAPAALDGSDHAVSMTPTSLAALGAADKETGYKKFDLAKLLPPSSGKTEKHTDTVANGPPLAQVGTPAPGGNRVETGPTNAPIVVDAKRRVPVPSFVGEPLRKVVESAGASGLGLQPLGDGIAREQAPVAGTLVPLGTEVVVRFRR
jgi:cell division protein FtsI (penicillin-binding protein 3)